jgi:hypothetical protein
VADVDFQVLATAREILLSERARDLIGGWREGLNSTLRPFEIYDYRDADGP